MSFGPAETSSVRPDAITGDLYCIGCGYNLRTLGVEAVCPECALPVRDSIISDAELAWLRRIRRGLLWLLLASILAAFTTVGFQLVVRLWGAKFSWILLSALRVLGAGTQVLAVRGVFLITRDSPHRPLAVLPRLGRAARLFALLSLVVLLFQWPLLDVLGIGAGQPMRRIAIPLVCGAMLTLLLFLRDGLAVTYLWRLLAGRHIVVRAWWIACLCCCTVTLLDCEISIYLHFQVHVLHSLARAPTWSENMYKVYTLLYLLNMGVLVVFWAKGRSALGRIVAPRQFQLARMVPATLEPAGPVQSPK